MNTGFAYLIFENNLVLARFFVALGLLYSFVLPITSFAQDTQHIIALGTVVDSAKRPLDQAQIIVSDATHPRIQTVETDSTGNFVIHGLNPETQYTFSIRKIGYLSASSQLATPQAGDTLWFDAILQPATSQLGAVNVTTKLNPAYHIDAAEIAKHPVLNALDVVLKYRSRMLGDAYKECRPDTSHLGPPQPPAMLPAPPGFPKFHTPAGVESQTYFDTSLAAHGYPPPPRLADPSDTLGKRPPYLYVNGILHTEWGMKNLLAEIPAEDIAELRYVDCWDKSVPERLRNALFVILKPGKEF
jgi:hypothetical protein